MECKEVSLLTPFKVVEVLIETLWNVKLIEASAKSVPVPGINRNIMECKDYNTIKGVEDKHRINRNIMECKVL